MEEKGLDRIWHPFYCYRNTSKQYQGCYPPPHHHDAYELYLFMSGSMSFHIDDVDLICQPGDIFLISPGQNHTFYCNEDCVYDRIILNITEDLMQKMSYDEDDLAECFKIETESKVRKISLSPRELERFMEMYERLQNARVQDGFGYTVNTYACLTQILVFVNRLFLSTQHDNSKNLMPALIRDVMTYIQEHLSEQITLEDLSEKFFFNGKYISRRFKKYTGLTIRTYILDQRIALAKKLLNNGCNVSEACYQSGFSDYANFIRSFTNFVGVSPGKYAKQSYPESK